MQPRAGQAVTMIVFGQTKRREFLGVLGGATVAWLCAARTQQPAMSVIGFSAARHPFRSRPTWRRSVEGWTKPVFMGDRPAKQFHLCRDPRIRNMPRLRTRR
jgi:hypothetical protein